MLTLWIIKVVLGIFIGFLIVRGSELIALGLRIRKLSPYQYKELQKAARTKESWDYYWRNK